MWVRRVEDGEEEMEKQMEAAAAAAEEEKEEEERRRRRRRHFSRAYRLPRGLLAVGTLQCQQCLPQVYL